MAHRNYSKCRKGHLGFLPKSRCSFSRPHIKSFPVDDQKKAPHLTGFITYKAGCTHVLALVEDHSTDKRVMKQVVKQVTVLDAPPMIGCGIAGYVQTPQGLRQAHTVWASHIAESVKRRFYKRQPEKNTAFSKHETIAAQKPEALKQAIETLKKDCQVIRLIAHTQPELTSLEAKKAQIIELQVNGGDVAAKVDFAFNLFEKEVKIADVFKVGEQVDTISITRGRGFEGVIHRWNVTRLPRKTRRGNRKVACIGSWHPANVQYTCGRAGQMGYFHRVDVNKLVTLIGSAEKKDCCKTEFDTTDKGINPLGGWPSYGLIKGDFIMIAGSCPGTKKRTVVLRPALLPHRNEHGLKLQWICTSSKNGHGMFETDEEKKAYFAQAKKYKAQQ